MKIWDEVVLPVKILVIVLVHLQCLLTSPEGYTVQLTILFTDVIGSGLYKKLCIQPNSAGQYPTRLSDCRSQLNSNLLDKK